MLFRALTIVCAVSAAVCLTACVTGETIGEFGCCSAYPNAITLDGQPVPGNGDVGYHWNEAWCAQLTNARHAWGTVNYWAFNTNCDYPPYETFWCDQFPRAMYQVGKKFDEHLLNYDWGDPFITCCEPDCSPPCCNMKYCDPCANVPCPVVCEPCPEPCPAPCPTYDPCPPR